MTDEKTCKDKVTEKWEARQEDLAKLLKVDNEGKEDPELGNLSEYGLCLDFVKPGTFKGQRVGYLRYQLSTGGPGDEIRFYQNGDIEYYYFEWFDGACVDIAGNEIARELLARFGDYEIEGWKCYKED